VPIAVSVVPQPLQTRDAEDTELVATRILIHRRCKYQATSRAPKVIRAAESELHLAAFAKRLSFRDRGSREGAEQKYKQDWLDTRRIRAAAPARCADLATGFCPCGHFADPCRMTPASPGEQSSAQTHDAREECRDAA
jgi:hypothetical protein